MLRTLLAAILLSTTGLTACGTTPEPAAEAGQPAAARVAVTEARVRAVPPGAPATAAFLTLTADGAATTLVAARSDAAKTVELHTHTEVDGTMQMRPVEQIAIPAGGAVPLEPGGLHIMLIGPTRALAEGDTVPLTLVFGDGSEQDVTAPVQPIVPGGGAHAHGDHAHDHTHGDGTTHSHAHGHDGAHGHDAEHDHAHEGATHAHAHGEPSATGGEATCACGQHDASEAKACGCGGKGEAEATCTCGKRGAECTCGEGAHAAAHGGTGPAKAEPKTCGCGMPAGSCACGGHGAGGHGGH